MRPGDMIIIAPPEDGAPRRYGWHWSVDVSLPVPVKTLETSLVKLETNLLYLVLTLINDRFSKRWALVTNGSVIAWQRTNCMRKA